MLRKIFTKVSKVTLPNWRDAPTIYGMFGESDVKAFEVQYDANADPYQETYWRRRVLAYTGEKLNKWEYGYPQPIPVIAAKHNC